MEEIRIKIGREEVVFDINNLYAAPGNQPQLEAKLAECARWQALLTTAAAEKRAELEIAKLEREKWQAQKYDECRLKASLLEGKTTTVTSIKNQLINQYQEEYSDHETRIINLQKEVEILEGLAKTMFHFGYHIQALLRGETWNVEEYSTYTQPATSTINYKPIPVEQNASSDQSTVKPTLKLRAKSS